MSVAGRLFLHGLYQPWCRLRDLWLDGGPSQRRLTETGRLEMEAAARCLPMLKDPVDSSSATLEIHLLTGRRYWFQTAFLLHSLAPHVRLQPILHDDGTLAGSPELGLLLQQCPAARLEAPSDTEARLDLHLPRKRFPALRSRRDSLVLMRKILDVHAGRLGRSLFLDSDMLCVSRPDLLIELYLKGVSPFHMADVTDAYGYPPAFLDALAKHPVPRRVNTGILALQSDSIDWQQLERICAVLNERPHYFQEQALFASVLATQDPIRLPSADYLVLPGRSDTHRPKAAILHFVAHSKRWYYQHAWRQFAP